MEIEADLYQFFNGWDALTTENMVLDELMKWHHIAVKRYQKQQAELKNKK